MPGLVVLQDAVERLSFGIGDSRERLKDALYKVCGLEPSDIAEELRPEFTRLKELCCPDANRLWNDTDERRARIAEHVDALGYEQCLKLTYELIKLTSDFEMQRARAKG